MKKLTKTEAVLIIVIMFLIPMPILALGLIKLVGAWGTWIAIFAWGFVSDRVWKRTK